MPPLRAEVEQAIARCSAARQDVATLDERSASMKETRRVVDVARQRKSELRALLDRISWDESDPQHIVEETAPGSRMDAIDARGWLGVAIQWVGEPAWAGIQVDEPPNDRFYESFGETEDEAIGGAYAVACTAEGW